MSLPPDRVLPSLCLLRRRRWLAGGALAGAVVALLLGLWLWYRSPRLTPPVPDLTGADPEVVETITQAHQDLLNTPSSAKAWGHLGMVLHAQGFFMEATTCFAQAERLNPQDSRWPYLQGVSLFAYDPEAAIACWERAVQRGPDVSLTPRLRLAEALLEWGRLDEAEQHLRQALLAEPDNLRARLDLGRLAIVRQQRRKALEQLGACVKDPHARKQARRLSAQVYRQLGEPKQAQAEEDQAAGLPEDEHWPDLYADEISPLRRGLQARMQQASGLVRTGQPRQAIQLLEETTTRYPESAEAWLLLGTIWSQFGRNDRAGQAFLKAVQVNPDTAEGWFQLGCVQTLSRRPRDAAESFRRVIGLQPDYTLAHFNLGLCLKALGDPGGAATELNAALRCNPGYAPAREALKKLEHPSGSP